MSDRLAIISVIYENYQVLDDFLKTLEKQTNKNFHLFLIDVSSNKRKISSKKVDITVINSDNLGYSHAVNLGIKKAINEGFFYFCVVNSDIYFKNDFVNQALLSLKEKPLSIISGKIYYAPGFEYHKSRYRKKELGKVLWYAGGFFDWKNVFIIHQGVDEVDGGKYERFKRTEFATGCLMIFDKEVIDKVGFWDESYFLYYEDADFCWRAKKKNIPIFYNPKIIIWHKNAQSTGGSGSTTHLKHQEKNRLKFGFKYASFKTKAHLFKELILKKRWLEEILFLVFIFILSLFLRVYTLPDNLFYAYEQGRDLLVMNKILEEKKLTLIGSRTSVEGIFHGPIYYYWGALGYFLARGNPVFITFFFILWQSFGAILFFYFIKKIFNKKLAFWGSLLYAVSYGLVVYSRWFSHPPLIIPFSILFFYSLFEIVKGKNFFYIPLIFFWGIIFQLDLVVAIFFVPGLIIFFVWQKLRIPSLKILMKSFLIFFLVFSSYLIFDLRHNFLMFNSFKRFFFNEVGGDNQSFLLVLKAIIDRYSLEIRDIISPNLPQSFFLLFIILIFVLFFKGKKTLGEKIVLIWVISLPTFGLFFSPLFGLKHYLVGLGPGIIIFFVMVIFNFFKKSFFAEILLIIIFLNNLILCLIWLPQNKNIFYLTTSSGKMIFKNQLNVINYVYGSSKNMPFSYESFTIPYWSQDGWRYLFSWYGKNNYGFIPKEGDGEKLFYVIIEPDGSQDYLNNWLKERFLGKSILIEEKDFGGIKVQKRIKNNVQ